MKTLVIFFFLFPFLGNYSFSQVNVKNDSISKLPIEFVLSGEKKTGFLLFQTYIDTVYSGASVCNVSFFDINGTIQKLLVDSTALYNVYDKKISQDCNYLALLKVSEGHSWIEILKIEDVFKGNPFSNLLEINPYPGNVEIVRWKKNCLIINADINLEKRNELKELEEGDMLTTYCSYEFNMKTGTFKKLK